MDAPNISEESRKATTLLTKKEETSEECYRVACPEIVLVHTAVHKEERVEMSNSSMRKITVVGRNGFIGTLGCRSVCLAAVGVAAED